jgi:hypothetical protein
MFITYYEIDTPEKKIEIEDSMLKAIGERNEQMMKVCNAISMLALFANENIKKEKNAAA